MSINPTTPVNCVYCRMTGRNSTATWAALDVRDRPTPLCERHKEVWYTSLVGLPRLVAEARSRLVPIDTLYGGNE